MQARSVAGLLALMTMVAGPAVTPGASAAQALPADLFDPAAVAAAPLLFPLPSLDRFMPAPAGTERDMSFDYGPIVVPPGSNLNRISLEVPPHDGFVTMYAPGMKDAITGAAPDHDQMHLHHAHWLKIGAPHEADYSPGMAWVFGTGGETTRADVDERSAAEPEGPRYGLFLQGGAPFEIVFMVHNFGREAAVLYLSVAVHWVYGSATQIAAAKDCGAGGMLPGYAGCAAGQEFHPLTGRLWGSSFDVPREVDGVDRYLYPPDEPLGLGWASGWTGTIVGMAGHMHENGRSITIVNLGPEGSGCEADTDGDGFPGVTLLTSGKVDRNPLAWPHTHDFQMETTKPHFRAALMKGDRVASIADYANREQATYGAMSYVGLYMDQAQDPGVADAKDCASRTPRLLPGGEGAATQGVISKDWGHDHGHLCGEAFDHPCDTEEPDRGAGQSTDTVNILDFKFMPGDRSLSGKDGAPVQVPTGKSLRFVNLDAAQGVMHAVTSCAWPCNGERTSNYPQADGVFASWRLGNVDPLEGGLSGAEAPIVWDTPSDLEPGLHSYYCRMHPWMRGAFEVAGEAAPEPAEPQQPGSDQPTPLETPRGTPGFEFSLVALGLAAVALARRRGS